MPTSVTDKLGPPLARLAGDICDHPITMNKDSAVDLPISLGIGVSDAEIEPYRAPEIAA